MELTDEASEIRSPITHSLLFLAAGLFVFLLGLTFVPAIPRNLLKATPITVLLVPGIATLGLRHSRGWNAYWEVAFAYFVAACGLALAGFTGDWTQLMSGQLLESPAGFAALKLGEDAAIVATVVILVLLIRRRLDSVFLTWGRFRLGLAVGLPSFIVLTMLGLGSVANCGGSWDRIVDLAPIFGATALADGVMEELLSRGLFLKRLGQTYGVRT